MYKIENIVPKTYQEDIKELLLGNSFPWYLNLGTANPSQKSAVFIDENTIDTKQFTHTFANQQEITSNFYHNIFPIIIFLESKLDKRFSNRILRIKANLITKTSDFPSHCYNIPHTDWGGVDPTIETETLLYYVNDSDGDTIFFNERLPTNSVTINGRITPRQGNSILFDSNLLHAGVPPRYSSERCVLNFVFRKEK